MGQWVLGNGSNGSTNLDGSRRSWVSACDPLTRIPLTGDYVLSLETVSVYYGITAIKRDVLL